MEKITDKELEKVSLEWVNKEAPKVFKTYEESGVSYNDESTCLLMHDAFAAGFRTCEEMADKVKS